MNIVDLHCDTILGCYMKKQDLHTYDGHINLEKLKAGGSLAQCFALCVPTGDFIKRMLGEDMEPWDMYRKLVDYYRTVVADASDVLRPA
ncbi:MAG: membrane dipeptidase [Oscillospiraceae bacterium]|nr:membrane dipeptidase [Oscillospiraceae bacterium]